MTVYQKELRRHQEHCKKETQLSNQLSAVRLSLALGMLAGVVQYFRTSECWWIGGALLLLVVFLMLVRWYSAVTHRKLFYQQLVRINEQEIAALQGDFSHFGPGETYVDPHHAYTFDLDIFGDNSLFQYLNRTANTFGADKLARYFLDHQDKTAIYQTQEAIQELAPQLEWRQKFLALGQLHADKGNTYRALLEWAGQPVEKTATPLRVLWLLLPALTIVLGVSCLLFPTVAPVGVFRMLLVGNLAVVAAHGKKFKAELSQLNAVHKIVRQYGTLLECIEKQSFTAPKLDQIRQKLSSEGVPASKAITRLSDLLHHLESVQNLIASLLFNSLFLYHLHVLLGLEKWKLRHAAHIRQWIDSIGEMEALCSLAHFAHNNPEFVFPTISDKAAIQITALGHPLIPREKRICNDIAFPQAGFVVLTGSNMSGKSTFLRTLGINLLLAKTGAPVCATACTTFPFDIHVCMKLSDSLHDNESYFYAELKRLHRIIENLEQGRPGFVLLDEVLRGTNSNDKLSGTLGLVDTMVRLKATGMLATHDLAVCERTAQHPYYLRNMCFEVEMTADNLHFDYRLRDGVCVNKSASFLMKKMGIIE